MLTRICVASWLCLGIVAPAFAGTATFDDLSSPPALNSSTGLFYANGGNSTYQGIVWDSRVSVVGDAYRVDAITPGPVYGIPHSGNYFITNSGDGTGNNGILLTTNQVLLGAWFGQNEYYGYGTGAIQVTIYALAGATELASVVFDLPAPAVAGQPGVMGYVDTSVFASLSGITGYRIDRVERNEFAGNWVADDFTFTAPAAVPEPSTISAILIGLGLLAARRTHRWKTT